MFRHLAHERGVASMLNIDSCGTGSWHVGQAPDPRAIEAARGRGFDISGLRARQLSVSDYTCFDYLLAMDDDNLAVLERFRPPGCTAVFIGLATHFATTVSDMAVPDPYFSEGFGRVLDILEDAMHGLLQRLTAECT